jgi:hypothetical protein
VIITLRPRARLGYKKYFESPEQLEARAIPVDIPGPTTPFLSSLPYKRLARPCWFPDRPEVDTPTLRRFESPRQRAVEQLATAEAEAPASAKL